MRVPFYVYPGLMSQMPLFTRGRAAIDYEAVARAIDVASFFPAVAPIEQLAVHWSRNLLAPAAPWTRAA